MAIIKPFQTIAPHKDHAKNVASLPYDVMNTEEARIMVADNKESFLNIDRPEIHFPQGTDPYQPEVYAKGKEVLENLIQTNILEQHDPMEFHIYRLIREGVAQTGLVCCTSVDEYLDNTIKKHEHTRPEKEQDRINHITALDMQTGPIFLAYKAKESITKLINEFASNNQPVYDFVSEDDVTHTVWCISAKENQSIIDTLIKEFEAVPNLYIADGHHRNASAVKVALKKRELAGENYDKSAEFNFYMSVVFPDNELKIMDYNRVIKDLNGLSKDDILKKVAEKFTLSNPTAEIQKPAKKHDFSMYVEGMWYTLTAKADILKDDAVKGLDVALLQDELLEPVLGIADPRTDKRIDFVGGIRGLEELKKRVDTGEMSIAFALYPTSMAELFAVADENEVMPPKSTWFEPKLRSGLFMHDISK